MNSPEEAKTAPIESRLTNFEFPPDLNLVFGLLRHSKFDMGKFPQVVGENGVAEGSAEYVGTKGLGYYDAPDGKRMTVPGLSTEQGRAETQALGEELGDKLASDGRPTYVVIAASTSLWPNEETGMEIGNRCFDTASALLQGLQVAAERQPDTLLIAPEISLDDRLRETEYQYPTTAIMDKCKQLAAEFGGDAKSYYINNHPEIDKLVHQFNSENEGAKLRTAPEIADDITSFFTERSASLSLAMARGNIDPDSVRLVIIGVTHAQGMKMFSEFAAGDNTAASQKAGYGDSGLVAYKAADADRTYDIIGTSK